LKTNENEELMCEEGLKQWKEKWRWMRVEKGGLIWGL
jgi:hypothetical protein